MNGIVFLKLGGSLITDKTRPYTPRLDLLADLAAQIAAAQSATSLRLVLGHGSGSFGHTAAKTFRTREGLPPSDPGTSAEDYWRGFAEVWYQASTLNRHVMDALHAAGVAALTFSPAASVTAESGRVAHWDLAGVRTALENGILPVVHGDVIFDRARGGTILSTEDLFEYLAQELRPQRILLAGLEAGVWADFPARTQRVTHITPATFEVVRAGLGGSHGADVTGGMDSKVRQMLNLAQRIPGLTAQIFGAEAPNHLRRALSGENVGTLINA